MDRFKSQLIQCRNALNFVCNKINKESYLSEEICCNDLYNALYNLIPLIPEEYYFLRNRLRDTILPNLKLLDVVQTDKCGREIIIPRNGINPYSLGEVIATLNYLQEISKDASSLWEAIHIKIKDVAKCRFDNGHYADAVEAASRSMKEYSPENISKLVDKIIDGKAAAGQFTNADISLREIDTVKEVLKTYLQQMYHSRVAYPRRRR